MLHLSLRGVALPLEALAELQAPTWQVLSDLVNVSGIKWEISKQSVLGKTTSPIDYFILEQEPRRDIHPIDETNAKIAGATETILLVAQ